MLGESKLNSNKAIFTKSENNHFLFWHSLVNSVESPTYLLQLMGTKDAQSLHEIVDTVYEDYVEKLFVNQDNFYVVG